MLTESYPLNIQLNYCFARTQTPMVSGSSVCYVSCHVLVQLMSAENRICPDVFACK